MEEAFLELLGEVDRARSLGQLRNLEQKARSLRSAWSTTTGAYRWADAVMHAINDRGSLEGWAVSTVTTLQQLPLLKGHNFAGGALGSTQEYQDIEKRNRDQIRRNNRPGRITESNPGGLRYLDE